MIDEKVEAVSKILSEWNPLGNAAKNISDLDEYRTEASDILFNIEMSFNKKINLTNILKIVLNQAFDLNLTNEDCYEAAKKIKLIL